MQSFGNQYFLKALFPRSKIFRASKCTISILVLGENFFQKYCGIIIEKMREVFGIGGYVSTAPLKLTGSVNSIHMARETMQSKTKRFLDEEKFKETVEHCTPISFYRKIIGRCGENLKTIEKVTRTAIVFKRSFDNNEACFSIRGRTDNIKQAIEKIEVFNFNFRLSVLVSIFRRSRTRISQRMMIRVSSKFVFQKTWLPGLLEGMA